MLSQLIILAIFVASLACAFYWGLARTVALVYLPAILFFDLTPAISLPGLPNLSANSAVGYASILMLLVCWREVAKIRLNALDLLVVLLMVPPTVSSFINDSAWDAISRSGEQYFRWIIPYFLGRIVMHDAEGRKALLYTVCISAMVIGLMACYEARLRPYAISRAMEQLKIAKTANEQVFWRFGLARAQTTLGHPIDLGVCGTLLGSFIFMLPATVGRRWTEPMMLCGLLGCGAMVVCSVSFTGFVAMGAAFVLIVVFNWRRYGPPLVLTSIIVEILGIFSVMAWMLNTVLPEERPEAKADESMWIRIKIIQEAWDMAASSGILGSGKYIDVRDVGTGSIDNAYLLFVLQNGWLYLFLWIAMALILGWMGFQALRRAQGPTERFPLAAGFAGAMATLLAMSTVYYGFVYSMLFLVLIGTLSTAYQIMVTARSTRPVAAPGGYSMLPAHGMGMPLGGHR